MKYLLLPVCFLFLHLAQPSHAQVYSNDFSQPGFASWLGDTAKFRIQNGRLQLFDASATANNFAYLSTLAPSSRDTFTRWEFLSIQEFSPSTTNLARVYLASDVPDLSQTQQGYFVQMGGITGNDDAVELFRLDGGIATLLIRGTVGAAATARVEARIRVERDTAGRWTLFADYTGGTNFKLEGTVLDPSRYLGPYFGPTCRYTSTRNQAFFFDDFLVSPLFRDRVPPQLLEVFPVSANELQVRFNEPLDEQTATERSLYRLDPGGTTPTQALLAPGDPASVLLTFASAVPPLQTYTLAVTSMRDLAGNASGPLSRMFTWIVLDRPQPGDLIVSEIMADPTPNQGVFPETEYLELYNASTKALDLQGVRIRVGTRTADLPSGRLLPGEYALICPSTAVAGFGPIPNIIGLASFPLLPNASGEIILSNQQGALLERINYSDTWYRDSQKRNGGFSLERIDVRKPGICPSNWQAARALEGGTPGASNSARPEDADTSGPVFIQAVTESPQELRLLFQEPLQTASASNVSLYTLSPAIPISLAQPEEEGSSVLLLLEQPMQAGTVYMVTVSGNIADCLGNPAGQPYTLVTGIPELPEAGDLRINELLFDPQTGGNDFVEVFNASDKIINLQGLRLRNAQRSTGNFETVIQTPWLIFPGQYTALTPNPDDLRQRYPVPDTARIALSAVPTMEAKSGNITLLRGTIVLDAFNYADSYHNPLLRSKKGVSLERISPQAPSNLPSSWHSAASSVGFATPGYRNSQFFPLNQSPQEEFFALENQAFSPDGDGFQDILLLRYQTDGPDYLVTIRIFDAQGRPVRTLVQKELLASEGFYIWDGANADGTKAPIGIYILWIEYLRPDGRVSVQKLTCVLAARL